MLNSPWDVHSRRCTVYTCRLQAARNASHAESLFPYSRDTRPRHFQFRCCLPCYWLLPMFPLNRNSLRSTNEKRNDKKIINVDVKEEKNERSEREKMGWWVSEIIKNNNWMENRGRKVIMHEQRFAILRVRHRPSITSSL